MSMRRQDSVAHARPVWITAIMLGVLLSNELASGQFLVQPMLIELTLRSGKRAVTEIRLENTGALSYGTIYVTVIELAQAEDAKWQAILPDSGVDTSKLSSCSKWISVNPSSVDVPPVTNVGVKLTITVPPGARGFYCAAIMARMRPPELPLEANEVGIGLDLRFVIPILLRIEGRPMRHNIELTDVGMESVEQTVANPATTFVSLKIANNGGTYSKLNSYARVEGMFAGHFRQITTAEFDEAGIIPGVEFTLKSDIKRSLPSGKYRVTGTLRVDGRRVQPFVKEIDFVGDSSVNVASVDTALVIDPAEVVMDSMPGATRTKTATVYNTSDEAVNVRIVPTIPPHLKGVAHGPELKGPDLNCAEWVTVKPEQFTLKAGGRQRILIGTTMPNPGKMHAYYYALLNLMTTYADGQNAGVSKAYVIVANKRVETRYGAVATREPTLGALEASEYVVVGGFGNVGNVHFKPRCKATITSPQSGTVQTIWLSGKLHSMLPLEVRNYSGLLDFSKIPDGTYRLSTIFEYAPGEVARVDKPIQVSVQGDRKVVQIVSEEELKKVGIEW